MVNPFKVKKFGAFLLAGFLPTIMFFLALTMYGLLYAYAFFIAGVVLATVVGVKLLSHPLIGVLEGSGLLVLSIDSTGLIKSYLAGVKPPYIGMRTPTKNFSSVFDRNTVSYLVNPEPMQVEKDGSEDIILKLPKTNYAKSAFSFGGTIPVLIYNSVLEEFYTKEMLASLETDTFVQHLVLHLNRKVDELTNSIRDFTRYIVEQTKPKASIFESKIFWIVLVIVIIIIFMISAPQIMQTLSTVQLPSLPTQPVNPGVTP